MRLDSTPCSTLQSKWRARLNLAKVMTKAMMSVLRLTSWQVSVSSKLRLKSRARTSAEIKPSRGLEY